jgi:hypothetical protein
LLGSTNGAQAASSTSQVTASPTAAHTLRRIPSRRLTGIVLGLTVVAGLATAPAATASTIARVPDATSAIALTTTVIDKPWYTVERFYLGLLNCTRTGGWVLSDGTCRGYGTGRYSAYVKPFTYSYGLSDKVSRPYAKLLAVRNLCTHFLSGDPGYRLRKVGYYSYTWGENIGCRDGYASAKAAVLASHLVFQGEKSSGGGHWKNIKNSRFKTVGIGIWRYGTRTRLVTDFYG